MAKAKSDRITILISALALVVSFSSSGFAVYQWWTTGRDERIRATIEVSNKYIEEAIDPYALTQQYKMMRRSYEAGQVDELEFKKTDPSLRIRKHYSRLEYISYLANNGRLALGYLSQYIICDLASAPDDLPEVKKFRDEKKLTCPSDEESDQRVDQKP